MAQMTSWIRQLETMHDIPGRQRIHWLSNAMPFASTKVKGQINMAIQRIKSTGRGAKYPVFFPVTSLVQWVLPSLPTAVPTTSLLLDRQIIQVRLTTMMRSCDVATIPWDLFFLRTEWHPDEPIFITCTTKNGQRRTFSILGDGVATILDYVWRHRDVPALFLCRYTERPHFCLGAERIAKRCLAVMSNLGIDTSIWKAHSLRGAVATQLLRQHVPRDWVMERGG